ncbi:5' nucleotidase, NT5C type [Rathayibacter soli]|uniref:5' nucleotidase, NT5C type n=1 Tax=Rathayibacter soli TaxID=3144168 RepID=UPI0027E5960A|nr:hypothetical protein [Glaciibacter superstes]
MSEATASAPKKILYVDLDNTLVDFQSGIERLDPRMRDGYRDDLDEAPGIFALMEPLTGALDAYRELARHFDTYILSTAPWKNPSAWHDKVEWVQKHLAMDDHDVAYKRLILSHHKNLNRGDFLVDDRSSNGAAEFEGEWLQFGPGARYPTWAAVTEYLLSRAAPSKLDEAIALARRAHSGQRDKLGVTYICHPLTVMSRVTTTDEKIVAVLHDVVEDTSVTLDDLRELGFAPHILDAVDAVTKRPGEPLADSMARVRAVPMALTIKKADISHNADPVRQAGLPDDVRARLTVKYTESARLLGTTLEEVLAPYRVPAPTSPASTATADAVTADAVTADARAAS